MAKRRRKRKSEYVRKQRRPSVPRPATGPTEPPWRHLWTVLAAAFAARAAVALGGEFILHPDEVMQYLEPAHWLVFGNGVLHWEFFYGARSWLVPSAVAAVLFLCQAIGLDSPFVYQAAVELAFCAVSLGVPLGMYLAGRALFGEASARLALLLGAFWYELVGFAHKPLTEFVAASLLLLLFALAVDRTPSTRRRTVAAGLLAAVCAAVRFQYAPAAGILLLALGARSPARSRLVLGGAVAAGALVVGTLDYLTWGGFLRSYFVNFDVNAVIAPSRAGQSTPWSYLAWFGIASGGAAAVAGAALLDLRRRGLVLLVLLSLLLPHLMLDHREYRFLFALVPLWLLLFADVLATGFGRRSGRAAVDGNALARFGRPAGLAYAGIVSVLGILNLIPMQGRVHRPVHAPETRFIHFLRDRNPAFDAYSRFADSPNAQGFLDTVHEYHQTRGYYGLHRSVPFYDALNWRGHFAPEAAHEYVSHVLATSHDGAQTVPLRGGGLALRAGSEVLPLPRLIGDVGNSRLEWWNEAGEKTILGGFRHAETFPEATHLHSGISGALSLWERVDDRLPIRGWETYAIHPDAAGVYPILRRTGRGDLRQPPPNQGIRLVPRTGSATE